MAQDNSSGINPEIIKKYEKKEQSSDSKNPFPFPSSDVDPAKKQEPEWNRQWAEAIFYRYVRNRALFTISQRAFFAELRSYGAGLQDPNKYKKPLLGRGKGNNPSSGETEWARKGWRNVNWEIFSPMPKYVRSLIGKFEGIDHNLIVKALDKKSGDEREDKMWTVWHDAQMQREIARIDSAIGVQQTEPTIIPESIDELQLFNEMGGFKVKSEVSMKKLLDHTEEISDIRDLKRKCIEDAINLNVYAFRDYYDPILCKQRYGYIDPTKLVVQYTRKKNFADTTFWGYYEDYTISELRSLTGATETELFQVAKQWAGYNAITPSFWSYPGYQQYWDESTNRFAYDDFKCTVFHAEYFSTDKLYKVQKKKKNGNIVMENQEFGKIYDTERKQTRIFSALNVYHCSWVIDTDLVFDYGKVPDMPRESKKTPRLSLHGYKLPGKSITESARPVIDQIQIAWLQLQNALAKAKPKGWAINISAIENINLGDPSSKPKDVIRMMNHTGDLIFRTVSHKGHLVNQGIPVHELPGGIGEFLNESITLLNFHFNTLVEIIGLDRFGAVSPGDQTATEAQLSVAATNDSTKLIYSGWLSMRESAAKNSCSRIATMVKYNPDCYDAYYPVLGQSNLEVLKLGESLTADQWGLTFRARPTQETIAQIHEVAVEAMKVGKNGMPGITFPQYLALMSLLEDGNVEYARVTLSRMIAQAERKAEAMKQQSVILQGKQIQEQAVVAEKAKQETLRMQAFFDIAKEAIVALFDEKSQQQAHMNSVRETVLNNIFQTPEFSQLYQQKQNVPVNQE